MEKLIGKTALVTGSTDGVGRLVARELGQAGARVLVHGHDSESGARVVADIEASGGAADFLAADLSALAEVRSLADAAQATVDRLDILISKCWNRHRWSASDQRRRDHVHDRSRGCARGYRRHGHLWAGGALKQAYGPVGGRGVRSFPKSPPEASRKPSR
jgi:NAD(P)-dependent dehydrogenase (short-subunit alcohol dehydrogenase family)